MQKQDFKYTLEYPCDSLLPVELGDLSLSKASLSDLGCLVPDYEMNGSVDLIGTAFNAAVINQFNRNGDGVDTKTGLRLARLFRHKPTNIEHKREKIVGHILSSAFSSYGTSQILNEYGGDFEDTVEPFNLALGAVVYKFVNKNFSEALLQSQNPNSPFFGKISTSWELGFNEFQIAVGSQDLKNCEIITDAKQIQEMKKYLKGYGGQGKLKDGTPIFRLVVGDVYPLGVAYTTDPAADVNGVLVREPSKDDEEDAKCCDEEPVAQRTYSFNGHNFTKKISPENNTAVNPQKESIMKNLENLVDELKASLTEKKISETVIASMTETFQKAIRDKDAEYKADIVASKEAAEALTKERDTLKASVEDIQKQLSDTKAEIEQFRIEKETAKALARFNSRMEEVDSMFALEDEDRAILVDDIKTIGESDEAFASFKNKLSVIWKHKSKAEKEAFDKEIAARVEAEVQKKLEILNASASGKAKDVEAVLESAKASTTAVPNNNEPSTRGSESVVEKFKAAFTKANITIS